MQEIHGKRADRSVELAALADQVRNLGRDSQSDEAKAEYAAVAAVYDRQADVARTAEAIDRTMHKEG